MKYAGIKVGLSSKFDFFYERCCYGCHLMGIGFFYVEIIHKDCICQECKKINCVCK